MDELSWREGAQSMITAIIPHFHEQRLSNLLRIASSLLTQNVKTVIWNNDKPLPIHVQDHLDLLNVTVVQSDTNIGCHGRFAAVPHVPSNTTHILFHDNDLVSISKNSVGRMMDQFTAQPRCIVSAIGEQRIYEHRQVPVSFGKFELIPKPIVEQLLASWSPSPDSLHDDLWLSVRAAKLGIPIRFIRLQWKNLDDDLAFWRSMPWSQWRRERERVFRMLMEKQQHETN